MFEDAATEQKTHRDSIESICPDKITFSCFKSHTCQVPHKLWITHVDSAVSVSWFSKTVQKPVNFEWTHSKIPSYRSSEAQVHNRASNFTWRNSSILRNPCPKLLFRESDLCSIDRKTFPSALASPTSTTGTTQPGQVKRAQNLYPQGYVLPTSGEQRFECYARPPSHAMFPKTSRSPNPPWCPSQHLQRKKPKHTPPVPQRERWEEALAAVNLEAWIRRSINNRAIHTMCAEITRAATERWNDGNTVPNKRMAVAENRMSTTTEESWDWWCNIVVVVVVDLILWNTREVDDDGTRTDRWGGWYEEVLLLIKDTR